jgi:hypothetical protein
MTQRREWARREPGIYLDNTLTPGQNTNLNKQLKKCTRLYKFWRGLKNVP